MMDNISFIWQDNYALTQQDICLISFDTFRCDTTTKWGKLLIGRSKLIAYVFGCFLCMKIAGELQLNSKCKNE